MKHLITGLAFLLFIAEIIPAQNPSNRRSDKLFGNVKLVRKEQSWTTKKAGLYTESKRVLMTIEKYDRAGNKVEWDGYMGSSEPLRCEFKYDSDGKIIEDKWYRFDDESTDTLYKYDLNGNQIEQVSSNGVKVTISYDRKNKRKIERVFDVAEDEGPRAFGPVGKMVQYSYDNRNNLIKVASFGPNGTKLIWNPEIQAHKIVYSYDASGNIRRKTVYNEHNLIRSRSNFLYDSYSRVINEIEYTRKEGTARYRYQYVDDNEGNWIRQIKSKQIIEKGRRLFQVIETIYREIEYY